MGQTLLATVISDPQPQPGQEHRSSGNFSTDLIPADTQYVSFEVVDNPNSSFIHFDVMEDKTLRVDPIIYENAYSGFESNIVTPYRSLYIANPQSATQEFTVNIYCNT